jgi:DNA-binding FadR family transcriptional regulator
MKFKKATQNRIFQNIVEQIEEAIVNGEIKPDERLPAERELCEQFRASRGTLREALRILEQKGLIEIRLGAGGGAFVRERHSELISENLGQLLRSDEATPAQLLQFMESIEAAVAVHAAKRAGTEDVRRLKELALTAQQHRDNGEEGWEEFEQTDAAVQTELYNMADNPVYGFVLQAVRTTLEHNLRPQRFDDEKEIDAALQELKMLVYAIGRKDVPLAARQARARVIRYGRSLGL